MPFLRGEEIEELLTLLSCLRERGRPVDPAQGEKGWHGAERFSKKQMMF